MPNKKKVKTPQSSPIPEKTQVGVSFPDALREVMNGNKITRLEWDKNIGSYGMLKDTFLQIYIRGAFHNWIINDGDLTATDWVVVKDN